MDAEQPFSSDNQISSVIALRDDLRHIVIEGVIGAGKTTLARVIADRFDGMLVLEQFEENPFLSRFYEDRPRWAFQTQLSFLASRFRQQQVLLKRDLFHHVVVSDYSFDKDRIFAHLNLDGDERHLYETLYNVMQAIIPVPDLVVYLQSTTERLLQNIAQRGRTYEQDMDQNYIQTLNDAYNQYFLHYTKSPLLIINSTDIDFVKNQAELQQLVKQIIHLRHPGTTFFNPTPTGQLHL